MSQTRPVGFPPWMHHITNELLIKPAPDWYAELIRHYRPRAYVWNPGAGSAGDKCIAGFEKYIYERETEQRGGSFLPLYAIDNLMEFLNNYDVTPKSSIRLPTSKEEAGLMILLGEKYLEYTT